MERVKTILEVDAQLIKTEPPKLIVTAKGQVPTTGWGPTQLLRRIYKSPPSDGVWEYDLLSTPPTGPAGNSISEVMASDTWEAYDSETVKGVRVYGVEACIIEKRLPDT